MLQDLELCKPANDCDHLDAEVVGRRDHRRLASMEYRPEQNPDPARLRHLESVAAKRFLLEGFFD